MSICNLNDVYNNFNQNNLSLKCDFGSISDTNTLRYTFCIRTFVQNFFLLLQNRENCYFLHATNKYADDDDEFFAKNIKSQKYKCTVV